MNVLVGIVKNNGVVDTMWVAANSNAAEFARNASAGYVMLVDLQQALGKWEMLSQRAVKGGELNG